MSGKLAQMLTEAVPGRKPGEVSAEDVALADAAEKWLTENGWEDHWRLGFYDPLAGLSFSVDPDDCAITMQIRQETVWEDAGSYRVNSLPMGLNTLVSLGILSPQFSPIRRNAMLRLAIAYEKTAESLEAGVRANTGFPHDPSSASIEAEAKAKALRVAAALARAESGAPA